VDARITHVSRCRERTDALVGAQVCLRGSAAERVVDTVERLVHRAWHGPSGEDHPMSDEPPNTIDSVSERPNEYPQVLRVRAHTLRADVGVASGSTDSAPGAHDYFDAALAACKALTATWYAKRHSIPLERVESHVERDDRDERRGKYRLRVRVAFHGPMTDEQRAALTRAVAACPIHKLMTTTEVEIETVA
jgi:putative redox protein